MTDHGPYETSDEVRRLPAVRAVYDTMHVAPGRGAGKDECERLLRDACEEAGVTLGAYDARIIRWLANWDPETCAVVAGWVTRAFEAGKAARPDGTATEWGTRFLDQNGGEHMGADFGSGLQAELFARSLADASNAPDWRGITVTREVTPWTPVPGEENGDG
jgi:hypothetical protein